MSGQLQRIITPRSPQIDLLESMEPREGLRFRGVRINSVLRYHCGPQFHACDQLLRWLKPEAQMLENESWLAESYRNKRFNQPLCADDLKPFCADYFGKGADK